MALITVLAIPGRMLLNSMMSSPAAAQDTAIAPATQSPGDTTESAAEVQASSDTHGSDASAAEPDHAGEAHDEHSGGHVDPVAEVLLAILLILLLAKIGGDLTERVGMPAVLGELTVGIILGNWALITGSHALDFFRPNPEDAHAMTGNTLDMLSRIGVVLLLFEVGLETRLKDMVKVGVSSLMVALLGVVAPILLGYGVGWLLIPKAGWHVHLFLGATLCATSVGITARVLKDIGRSRDRESRIILGAAVIDDVLGLLVLTVVQGIIITSNEGGEFAVSGLLKTVGLSVGFLIFALLLGLLQFPKYLFRAATFLRGRGLLVTTSLVICFLFSWGANKVELAPIIGAFAAGLILEGAHYQEAGERWKDHHLEDALAPLTTLLVPIFFVATGITVDLSGFGESSVWLLAGALTLAAIVGKQVCSFGVLEKGRNRLAVGIGMIPRGEVGLIFAGVGKSLKDAAGEPLLSTTTFNAIVVMVMITTMVTPPLLKWSMNKTPAEEEAA